MKAKAKDKRDDPVKVPLPFDEAMRRAVKVRPPAEGWQKHIEKAQRQRQRKAKKRAN